LKNKLGTILKLSFFLGLGFFFIWLFVRNLTSAQINEILISFKRANYWWLFLSMLIGVTSHAVRAARWKMLMEPLGYTPRFINVFFAVFIGYLANLALPRLGEVSRCGVLTRYEKIPFNKSFGTVIAERALDMVVFLVIFFVTILMQFAELKDYLYARIIEPLFGKVYLSGGPSYITWGIILLMLGFFVMLYLLRKRFYHINIVMKIRDMLVGFLDGMKSLIHLRRPVTFAFYTILIWVCYYLMSYLVFFSLSETSHLSPLAGLAVLVFGSVGIMVVQGGIGVYQAIVAETLVLYGVTSTIGYAMGWLMWSAQNLMILVVGLVSLALLPLFNRNRINNG